MGCLKVSLKVLGVSGRESFVPAAMVTEYLSIMTDKLVENGTIDGFKVSNRAKWIVISHLQFA